MQLDPLAEQVWAKGNIIFGQDSNNIRRDDMGNVIHHDDYGNRKSAYGWEIDHIVPVSQKGSDDLSNLRPLQWEANVNRN